MMNCQDIENQLDNRGAMDLTPAQQRRVGNHLLTCESCKSAWRAAQALRDWGRIPAPQPRAGFFAETMDRAKRQPAALPRRGSFWLGTAVGGALAASIMVVVMSLSLDRNAGNSAGDAPLLAMALNQTRDVSIDIDAAEALNDAQIRVVLSGGIELAGFGERNAIAWSTDLARGHNRLTLPLTAIDPGVGQVLVEVAYGSRRQLFLVRVSVDAGDDQLGATPVTGARGGLTAASRPDIVKSPQPQGVLVRVTT